MSNRKNNMTKSDTHICNICSLQYLSQALTMIWSMKRFHIDYCYHIFLSDVTSKNSLNIEDKYQNINFHFMDDFLQQHDFDNALFLTDIEFHTSIKPMAMEYLLRKYNKTVFYCDSDLFFVGPLDIENKRESIILTPHHHLYQNDQSDLAMARSGIFNAGFIGASGEVGLDFVNWWKHKTRLYCFLEPEEGLFVDQKWLDMVPALFDSVLILRDQRYNLSYWNSAQRTLDKNTIFIHLSGMSLGRKPGVGEKLSKHSNVRMDSQLVALLSNYYITYSDNKETIDKIVDCNYLTEFGKITSRKKSVIDKRYMAKKFFIDFSDGTPVLKKRDGNEFSIANMHRTKTSGIFLVSFFGWLFVSVGLGRVIEIILKINRVLSRRSNWIK